MKPFILQLDHYNFTIFQSFFIFNLGGYPEDEPNLNNYKYILFENDGGSNWSTDDLGILLSNSS